MAYEITAAIPIKLNVLVTIPLPYYQLRNIIKQFTRERLTFGLHERENGEYQIWRAAHKDEAPKRNYGSHARDNCIIERKHPSVHEFSYLWVEGEKVDMRYKISI